MIQHFGLFDVINCLFLYQQKSLMRSQTPSRTEVWWNDCREVSNAVKFHNLESDEGQEDQV